MSGSLRIGLAGVGRFGQLHAAALANLPGVQLAAIADPNGSSLRQVVDHYGVATCYPDAMALIEDDSLDAVILATPDELHAAQVRAAIARGHHVFVEKPLAATWAEARDLQRLAQEANLILQAGLILRYETSHRLLQQQIVAGQFGQLVSIRCQRNCSRASFASIADRIHTVHRTLIHDIDLLLWLSQSSATSVMALEYREGPQLSPQGCYALVKLANGCVGQLESSWYVPAQAPANVVNEHWHSCIDAELAVVGTQRTAKLRGLDSPLQIWSDQDLQHPDVSLWPELGGAVSGALRDQLLDFTTCVHSKRVSSVANLANAVESLRIAEAIMESSRSCHSLRL